MPVLKISLSASTLNWLCNAGLAGSVLLSALALYNISNKFMPTLFILILLYALFFGLGLLYYKFIVRRSAKTRQEKAEKRLGRRKTAYLRHVFHRPAAVPFNHRGRKRHVAASQAKGAKTPEPPGAHVARPTGPRPHRSLSPDTTYLLLQVLFYLTLLLSAGLLSQSVYTKPDLYYVLVAAAVALTGAQIIVKKTFSRPEEIAILFLQILPVALLLRGSSYLINPYLIGPDTPYHFHLIEAILDSGHLSDTAYHYYYYPAYHLIQAVAGQLLSFSLRSFEVVNLATSAVLILFAYLTGKELLNSKAGLLCALFTTVSTMLIYLVDFNMSKIGGATLLFIVLYLLVKLHNGLNKPLLYVLLIVLVPLFFWHTEIFFALVVVMISDLLASLLFRNVAEIYRSAVYAVFLLVAFFYWLSTSTNIALIIAGSIFSFSATGVVQEIAGETVTWGFLAETALAYLGLAIPVLLATVLGFRALKGAGRNLTMLLVAIVLIHVTPLVGIVTGSVGAGPGRTLTYASIILLVAASLGAYYLVKGRRMRNLPALALCSLIIFGFAFFSVSSYLIGDGNGILNDQVPAGRVYTTDSNVLTYGFLTRIPFGSVITSDYESTRYTTDAVRGFYSLPFRRIITLEEFYDLNKGGDNPEKDFVLLELPILEKKKWETTDWGKLAMSCTGTYSKLYNNGEVAIYYG